MKNAFLKDARREILHSFSRFLSIFLIVFLGVGFYSGINSTMPDMKYTAGEYFKQTDLMDLKLVSTLGIKAEDIKNIKKLDFVDGVSVGYSKDVFYKYDSKNLVIKFMSFNENHTFGNDNLNKLTVLQGRLPEKAGECVVDEKFINYKHGFKIGDQITVSSPYADTSIDEIFTTDTFTIVGYVTTPLYIGYERDKTTVGNGNVSGYVFINENDFNLDYYSEMYITLKNCDFEPSSEEYLDAVNENRQTIIDVFSQSVNERYDYLFNLYTNKISSAENSVSQLETFLNAELDDLYVQKAYLENLISEYEKQFDNSSSNLLNLKISKAKALLSQLDELIYAKENNDTDKLNELNEKLNDYKEEIFQSKTELEKLSQPVILDYDRFYNSDYSSFEGDAEKIHSIGKVFPLFFVIVAALVCLTTMTRMIEEQRTQIGIYKALGYTSFQIVLKYLIYGGIGAFFGSFLGYIVGVKVLPAVIFNCYKILYNIPCFYTQINWKNAFLISVFSTFLTCVVVIYSCYKELKIQPSQLMRPKSPKSGRRVFLEKFPFLWNKISFIGKVTIRNLLRYKKRFLMTVFGVAGCTALILTGFGLKHSISAILDLQFNKVFCYDSMALIDCSSYDSVQVLSEISQINGVVDCDLSCQVGCEIPNGIETYTGTIVVVDDVTNISKYVNLIDVNNGKALNINNNGVIINEKLSLLLDLNVGDEITIDLADKGKVTFTVDGITENYALHYIYISKELYEEKVESPTFNTCFINYDSNKSSEELSENILSIDGILGITNLEDNGKSFEKSLKSLTGIVWLLIICAGALAMVVLYNLANINITERVREIATIKVLGFYDNETDGYIFRENIFSALIGIILGWFFGKYLHRFVVQTAEVDIVMFDRTLELSSYIISALLTLLFTAVIIFILHFKLKKVDMVSSLKSVE